MMSVEVNPKLTVAENLAKTLIFDPAVKFGLTALFANPQTVWMNVWPFRPIIVTAVNQFEGLLFQGFTLFVDVNAIKLLNQEHQTAYDQASLKLKVIAKDYGSLSKEFQDALNAETIAQSKFTHFNQ